MAGVLAATAETYPALRRLLEEHAGHPAVAEGRDRFRRTVLGATGVDPVGLMPKRPNHEKGYSHDRKSAFCTALRPVRAWLH